MRRIRIIGLALVAVFALSAGAASSASAAPELGECLPTKKIVGNTQYADAGCIKPAKKAAEEKFEWHPGPGPGEETFKSKGGKATLEGVGGEKITCKAVTNTGKYIGAFEDTTKVIFTGCEAVAFKAKCQTKGGAAGVITIELKSSIGIIKKGALGKSSLGVDLEALPPATALAVFECAGAEIIVTGSVIAPETVANKMETKFTQKFKATKGLQEPEKFEGAPKDTLVTEIPVLGKKEQSGQTVAVTVENSSPVEIREF